MSGLRLTRRGELLMSVLIVAGLLGATWTASAIGYWLTGVRG